MSSSAPAPRSDPASAPEPNSAEGLAGIRILRSFAGVEPGEDILSAIGGGRTSGVTLFEHENVTSPAQVRELCAALQAARPAGDPPLVIGFDQEGGQLQLVGDPATTWPGNLALGAAGSEELALATARAIGREVAAMGGTLVYAPVCDLLARGPATPLGTRPFGDDPNLAARLAAAMTRGFQEAGIAATLKHFPGHGNAAGDSHKVLPVITSDEAGLRPGERPFKAGIDAGAKAVMPGHLAIPSITHDASMPATVSRAVLQGLLRERLGFDGVVVSDALDMQGASYGRGLGDTVVAAADAGQDLLLLNHPPEVEETAFEALRDAISAGRLDAAGLSLARERVMRLRKGFHAIVQPSLDVVGCEEHRRLARAIADAAVTLVRDPERLIPLSPEKAPRVAVIAPQPADLTPAETNSRIRLGLAGALRERGLNVDQRTCSLDPTSEEVAGFVASMSGYDVAIVGTYDAIAFPGQLALVRALAEKGAAGTRVLAVALRSPYDIAMLPQTVGVACTYGVQAPQIEALADALVGRIKFSGRLPVKVDPAP